MKHQYGFFGTNGDALSPCWSKNGDGSFTVDVQSNRARILTATTAGNAARATLLVPYDNCDMIARITPAQAWTGTVVTVEFGDNTFSANNNIAKNGVGFFPTHEVYKQIADVFTTLTTASGTLTASNPIWVRLRKKNNGVAVRFWDDGSNEPAAWTVADIGVPPTARLYPSIGVACLSNGSAVRVDVDALSVDDLRPIRIASRLVVAA